MTNDDRPRFLVALTVLGVMFKTEVSEALAEAYWIGLEDIDLEDVEYAAKRLLRESKFMPVAAEIRTVARDNPTWMRRRREALKEADREDSSRELTYREARDLEIAAEKKASGYNDPTRERKAGDA